MPYPEPPSDLIEKWLAEPEYATADTLYQKVELVTLTTTRLKRLLNRAAAWGYQKCDAEYELDAMAALCPPPFEDGGLMDTDI
jgi:hypothetical protein